MTEQPDLEGKRVVAPDAPGIWLVLLGQRRHITEPDVYDALFPDGNGLVSEPALTALPVGPALGAGTGLIRRDGDPAIYLLAVAPDGTALRHWITTEETFHRLHLDPQKIYTVAAADVAAIEEGAALP
ncbi:hypothetical protein OPKNFCMD_4257 [Methylobacterium crusticola]|uniref:Uncharacterized protein n=1 Tax=Methylobacterium crusticola TaxID=1697972 RepID=A0ABQ4R436_9HYPH|nr:hypothetical protein [Methylobacterium crusticola]GJD51502.1 hypothetical protein OPKNFCMD_4257 [Methylobacterium crusticola]